MLFTAPALDFLLAYLLSLSFRHLVCLLSSRDRVWILTQQLCFGFYSCKALCSHHPVDWGCVCAFFLSNTKPLRNSLLCTCTIFAKEVFASAQDICTLHLPWAFPVVKESMIKWSCSSQCTSVKYMMGNNAGESPLQDWGFHLLIWWVSSWISGLRHILLYNRDAVDSNPLSQVISSLSVLST